MVKIFSYGSNSIKQLIERVGRIGDMKFNSGVIKDHVRIFAGYSSRWGGGVASIYPMKNKEVKGLIVEMTMKELKRLDKFEGGYTRKKIGAKEKIKNKYQDIECYVYIKNNQEFSDLPSESYCKAIINMLNERKSKRTDKIEINGLYEFDGVYHLTRYGYYNNKSGYQKMKI